MSLETSTSRPRRFSAHLHGLSTEFEIMAEEIDSLQREREDLKAKRVFCILSDAESVLKFCRSEEAHRGAQRKGRMRTIQERYHGRSWNHGFVARRTNDDFYTIRIRLQVSLKICQPSSVSQTRT